MITQEVKSIVMNTSKLVSPNKPVAKKFAILIPTYNEKNNVEKLITDLRSFYPNAVVYIIDDNSPDGTGNIVKRLAKQDDKLILIERSKKEGIGKAYLHGFAEVLNTTKLELIVQMDADFSHNPLYIKDMLAEIEQYDLVIGSRYIKGISVINWSLWRVLLSYFASKYVNFFTRLAVRDTTGGFKCFKREVLESINLEAISSDGYCFQVEMNYLVKMFGFKIKEVPIIFVDRTAGESKISKRIIVEALIRVPFFFWKSFSKGKYRNKNFKKNHFK